MIYSEAIFLSPIYHTVYIIIDLLPIQMFHSRGGRQFQRVEVRVGDDDPGNEYSSIKDRNTFCSSFLDKGKQMKYYDFECSKYGLKGKYITLTSSLASNQKERYDVFSAAEVELFGKLCLISYTLNISLIKYL